ncbi:MAG TPA: hypothetical protein PKK59_05275 [Anaerolineaceae bacterium]|nr:hypothetical protein [Anaerolineaceae bacterium]
MLKKIIWVFMLLVMTACTILFKDGVDIVLSELTPTVVSTVLADTGENGIIPTEAVPTAVPVATEPPLPEPSPTTDPTKEPSKEPAATPIPFEAVYVVQPGSPVYLDNFAHLSEGCGWQGIAGQIFGADGEPVMNLIVKLSGEWNGKEVAIIAVTGMVAGLPYGPGGYEIVLGDKAITTTAPLYLQVFDDKQNPLTEAISVMTQADCQKNLMLMNFVTK